MDYQDPTVIDPGFSLVNEGENHFLVQHPNGAQAVIAKKDLPEAQQNEIRGLPTLGQVALNTVAPGSGGLLNNIETAQDVKEPDPIDTTQLQPPQPIQATANPIPAIQPAMPTGYDQAYGMQIQGINDLGKAQAQNAATIDQATKAYQQHVQDATKLYTDKRMALDTEQAQLQKNFENGKVDPNHFWDTQTGVKGGANRVLSMLGLFLGGIGTIKGTGNPAQMMLDKAIQNDIDAQKENLGKNKTLLDLNLKKYGDLSQAEQATKLDMMNMFNVQLQGVASKTQSQQVKANALYQTGEIAAKMAELKDKFAKEQTSKQLSSVLGAQNIPDAALPQLGDENKKIVRVGPDQNRLARDEDSAKELNQSLPAINHTIDLIRNMREELKAGKTSSQALPNVLGMSHLTPAGRRGINAQTTLTDALRNVGKSSQRMSEYINENYLQERIPNPAQWSSGESLHMLNNLENELIGKKDQMMSQGLMTYHPTSFVQQPGRAK